MFVGRVVIVVWSLGSRRRGGLFHIRTSDDNGLRKMIDVGE
jgi:hypothetical protein